MSWSKKYTLYLVRRSYKRLIRKMSKDPNVENVELTALWNVVKYRYPSLSDDEVWEELAPFYGDCTGDESIESLGEYFLYKEVGELGIHDKNLLQRAVNIGAMAAIKLAFEAESTYVSNLSYLYSGIQSNRSWCDFLEEDIRRKIVGGYEQLVGTTAERENEYFSNEYHFRIIFPEGWEVMKTQFGGVQAVSREGGGKEAFITIHKEEATMDHRRVLENNELGDYRLSFFEEKGLSVELLEQGKGAVGQEKGCWAEVHVSGFYPQYEKTYVVVKGEGLYTLSTMVTPDDTSWYEKNRALFEQAVRSFEID